MLHRVSTGFGWVDASVDRAGDQWVATLADHHPSLGGVGPGFGQTPEEALGDLSAGIGRLCSARKHATNAAAAVARDSRASGPRDT